MPLPKDPIKAEETRRKMSEAAKKRMADPEYREKMSKAHKGKKQSPESIAKTVAANTGQQRSPRIMKNCAFCGKEMILLERAKNRKFCSVVCKGKWQSENAVGEKGAHWQGGDITKKCEECGKEFSVEKNRMGTARFCSSHCKGIWLAKHDKIPKFPHLVGPNHPNWTGGKITKKCEECGEDFEIGKNRKDSAKFCSQICKGIWMSKNNVGEKNPTWRRVAITCEECGKVFFVKTRMRDTARFCSRACRAKFKSTIKICEDCGKEFTIGAHRRDTGHFCSQKCKGSWQSKNILGDKHPNWMGGPKDYCEKWSLEFRRRIRAFFNFECAECGTPQNEKLFHCHHVYYDKKACCSVNEDGKYLSNLGIKDNPHSFEIIGDPNKFILLCDSCHAKSSGKKKREFWARHFEEIINQYYLGRSYFTKEEYEKIR
jgi:endogenous inhibitor of DNA gyrase (YacG/DUF329 family)